MFLFSVPFLVFQTFVVSVFVCLLAFLVAPSSRPSMSPTARPSEYPTFAPTSGACTGLTVSVIRPANWRVSLDGQYKCENKTSNENGTAILNKCQFVATKSYVGPNLYKNVQLVQFCSFFFCFVTV